MDAKERGSWEEMERRMKELQEKNEQSEREKKELQEKNEQNEREKKEMEDKAERDKQEAQEAILLAKEGERKAKEDEQKATQKTNLLEFLDAVHVHLSSNIRVETNPAWTTKGSITDPTGKTCPKFFREWEDFHECQGRRWAKVVETTDDFSSARVFSPLIYFKEVARQVKKQPIGSEKTLEYIERLTLETPVESLLEYLSTCDSKANKLGLHGGIAFENHNNTLSNNYDETQDRLDKLNITTPSKQKQPNTSSSRANRHRPGGASYPDAFCVYRRNDKKQVPLAAVELKPPHKLPTTILLGGMRDMDLLTDVVNRATIPVKKDDPEAYFKYQADRLVAAAVTQTFSYMIENGLEYGYLGTGEAFVFLHTMQTRHCQYYRANRLSRLKGVDEALQGT